MPGRDCVSDNDLRSFLLGDLPEPLTRAITGHLEACPACEASARRLDDLTDPMIRSLQRALGADGHRDTPQPRSTAAVPHGDGEQLPGPEAAPEAHPRLGGGYEVLGEIGRGGMGVVYKARQTYPRRVVALKMILAGGYADPSRRARFLAEGDAIARLQHPNIVQIHEVGQHDGLPFLVLEYVGGGSLADRVRGVPQLPRQAAALAETLARAVHHAHAQGVVHRDLKPGNVLLGEDGQPRITDFGLARHERPGLTATGDVLGTPSYMAPEQAAGSQAVGPAADVWALGAILYECLTGRPPFLAAGLMETLLLVRDEEPAPPRLLNPKVPRDLETVCLKCLRKEPAKRYGSAQALAEDLRRYQEGRPIEARPVGRLERLVRWCRREPVVAGLLAAVLVVLTAGVVSLSVGLWALGLEQRRTAEALGTAEENLERAEEAEATATGNLRQAEANLKLARKAVDDCYNVVEKDPLFQGPRMEKARKVLLKMTLPFYREFRAQRGDDRQLQHEEARQFSWVGNIARVLGDTREAVHSFQQARDRFAKLVQAHPDVPEYQSDLARAHNHLGVLLRSRSRHAEALREYEQARLIRGRLAQAHPDVPDYQDALAKTHDNLGNLLRSRSSHAEALKEYQQARLIRSRLVHTHPDVPQYQDSLARTHNNLGVLLRSQNRQAEALKEYEQARLLLSRLAQAHPDVPQYQNVLAATHSNLGVLLSSQSKHAEALKEYQQARLIFSRLAQAHPDVPQYQNSLAMTHNNLGVLLESQSKHAEALEEYEQARLIRGRLAHAHPDVPDYQNALAKTHNHLGNLLRSRSSHAEALKEYEEARLIQSRLVQAHPDVPEYQTDLAHTHYNLGILLRSQSKHAEALREYEQARLIQSRLVQAHPDVPEYQTDLAKTNSNLGNLLWLQSKHAEALEQYQQARLIRGRLAQAHPDVPDYLEGLARTCLNRGNLLLQMNRLGEAVVDLDETIASTEKLARLDPRHPKLGVFLRDGLSGRAIALECLGRLREADAIWDRVLALVPPDQRPAVRLQRADSRARTGDYLRSAAEAEELAREETLPGAVLYNLAWVQALNVASADRDTARPLPEREKRGEGYARQAVALLQRAASAGHFREQARVAHVDRDDDLAVLRQRTDYRAFRATLKPAAP